MGAFTFNSPDGKQYTVNGPDGATSDQAFAVLQKQLAAGTAAPSTTAKQPAADNSIGQDIKVAGNAAWKGLAGIPDALLNTPNNIFNLGKAAYGTAATALGHPDAAPDITPNPDLINRGMHAIGLIRNEAEPQTPAQRVIDSGAQGAMGALAGSAAGGGALIARALTGAAGGAAGGAVQEATGDPRLAIIASMLAPSAASAVGNTARSRIATAMQANEANAPRLATLRAAQEAGLSVPPALSNPSAANQVATGLAGGNSAVAKQASRNNIPKVDVMARGEAGLAPDQAITPENLKAARIDIAQPYRDIKGIGNLQVDAQYGGSPLGPKPFTGPMNAQTIPAAKAVDSIKQLRSDGYGYQNAYKRSGDPEMLTKAKANLSAADDLEALIERNLQKSADVASIQKLGNVKASLGMIARALQGQADENILSKFGDARTAIENATQKINGTSSTDLLDNFRAARTALAKNYNVESALREGGGTIDARVLGRATQNQAPLSGPLKTIGDFANNFGPAMQPAHSVGSPSGGPFQTASALGASVLGHEAMGLPGAAAGALPLVVPPAMRALVLSAPYQKIMAQTGVSPGVLAQTLAKMPANSTPEQVTQALMIGRAIAQRQ